MARKLGRGLLFVLMGCLAGCLPYACRRETSRALLPADSLSRHVAEQVPVDTLRLVWRTAGPADRPLQHPRTVLFGPAGRLYVADTERNSLYVFSQDGTFVEEVTSDAFSFPYLAGVRGDTLLVFNPGAKRLHFVVDGTLVRNVPTPDDLPQSNALQYAAATADAVYFKTVGDDFDGYVARLDGRGNVTERISLPGPVWRHAGLLRPWGDSLISVSGFRPVVDVLSPDGILDTLALVGFDSPMLARSRAFLLGETHEPPLLAASAAAADLLFVINVRPGWLRVDAYDHGGRLQHVYVQERPGVDRRFYPSDLSVRRTGDGIYEIAVVSRTPEPRLMLYRTPGP